MRTRLLAFAGFLTACTGCVERPLERAPQTAIAHSEREPTRAEIIERSLPSIVLVLNYRPDGSTMYGSGVFVRPGLVLTSQHVVLGAKSIGVMLYKPERTSYTPMDGGLARYLFENQGDILRARVVDGDPTTDLAVLELPGNVSGRPLGIASEPPKRGDRVLALGHPQETVWSFTEGVVGAIHQGAIQHDARVSHGNSGGPLLNTRGEVIGINVAKVMSVAEGLAFARPIAMASRFLDASPRSTELNLETPERAAMACWRAEELALPNIGDCFDWEASWTLYQGVASEALRLAPSAAARARISESVNGPGAKRDWIAQGREHAEGFARGSKPAKAERPTEIDVPREVAEARLAVEASEAELLRKHEDQRGVRADAKDSSKLKARLRMGIRVEEVRRIDGDRAWVLLAGRGPDGSSYRLSELWGKRDKRWLQHWPPSVADTARLPAGWPPPLVTFAEFRVKELEHLLTPRPGELAPTREACKRGQEGPRSGHVGGGAASRALLAE